jgi:mRNA interferase RelE/StbE
LKTQFKESFLKDIEALGDSAITKRIRKAIAQAEQASAPKGVRNLKKLKGGDRYYRIRIGDYHLGLVLDEDALVFIRCLHHKDIDRYLP